MKDFYDWQYSMRSKIAEINQRLLDSIQTDEKYLYDMARYTIEAGGKRFRPLLTILSFEIASGESYEKILDLAAGYELIHTASLIHDDIIDHSDMRRGRYTLSYKEGINNAIVVGDYLFAKAYELGSRYGKEVSKIMADASSNLAEGQILEAENIGNLNMNEETYLKIIENKTARFFAACALGATKAAGADFEISNRLSNFAYNMGMAFQITDDILDIIGNEKDMGKPAMVDLGHDVITLPIIYSLKNNYYNNKIRDILTGNYKSPDLKDKFKNIMMETGAIEYSFKVAKDYINKSVSYLSGIGRSRDLDLLMELAMIVIERIDEAGLM
ncbi:polyprenyl synthetase family protein [Picrophilus oshimae]|uniref:Farnesyl pyrophosphate synthetase/ geranyltransferase/farnesyltransferase/hexaprenyl diphosphate synthase n=1 Tax=Picrophilus torridus (strain ATCC 700027 / DSM 9790 / JCM 10055 / NBRC 100828 / KAW 2/3) TaxID=1122961 RepID=Q6KZR8_PICTO|nr:polyprenyl synthetase family protein [Picrophilus oshimae]AAT43784.1 farnesyl pyrophosphate synthetase/ geranyltransferase/farnesyltransferase/hexaprenyl diphosphate synthase [Picrophilus oshimae DSM 9789]SMD31149.1 octaprenyl-diphosphate synthase [Picrophilus oshimae DSM 9789]